MVSTGSKINYLAFNYLQFFLITLINVREALTSTRVSGVNHHGYVSNRVVVYCHYFLWVWVSKIFVLKLVFQ